MSKYSTCFSDKPQITVYFSVGGKRWSGFDFKNQSFFKTIKIKTLKQTLQNNPKISVLVMEMIQVRKLN